MSDAASEIKKTWHIISVGDDSVLELRALWPKGVPENRPPQTKHFRRADYPNVDVLRSAFEDTALKLNRQGYNIYTVMNPIKPDFSGTGSAKDRDIRYRDLLLVDIDRVGDTSCPASRAELDAARVLAGQLQAHMSSRGWPAPIVVMSGNGYHLYYCLSDLDNDDQAAALVKTTLNNLATVFKSDVVGVDTTVYNASRITKVPGTIMRKGVESEDRPYRMAVVCDEE
ncbi:MAG: hypothetical protein WCS09_07160 [Pseudomonadota bacterium]